MARAAFLRLPGRGGPHAAWLIIGFSVLCACAILANLAYQVLQGRADVLANASRNTAAMARVLEAHTIASVDATELALLSTVNALGMLAPGDPRRGAKIDHLLAESIDRLPFIRAIWVLDADGNMIHDSQRLPGSYNLAEREYFRIHRAEPKRGLYIDQPIVSKHGVPFIGLSRRVDRPDGSFGGVVVAALEPDYLRRFYQSIRSGRDGAVALVRRDGALLLRVPELPINPTRPHPANRFIGESDKALEGSYRDTSAFDGIERLYFFRHVTRRPLLVVIGIGTGEMLAGWHRTSLAYGAVSLGFLLLVAGLARFALRELANRQRMNRALADSERALRAAQRLSNTGSWSLDRVSKEGRWSEEMYRIFGLEPAALAPSLEAFLELIHPDDRTALRQAGATSTPWSGLLRTNPEHGPLRYLQARASLVESELMGTLQDVTEQRRADENIRHATAQLQFMHSHDPLTGLPNRSLLGDRLLQAIDAARPQQRRLAVLLLNVDRLKRVNEGIGHDAGDLLLAEVGARLSARLQPGDTLARLGSDEFVMLLGSPGDSGDINAGARQLLDAVAQPFDLHGHELTVTASIGIALYPEDGATPGELLKNADSALTHAKEAGRNSFRYFTAQMNVRALHWMSLEHRLRGALGRGELLLHYQPQMALGTGRLCGAEALIRWHNGDAGLVSPADFIPLAEDTGLILPIGDWVIRSACRQARAWQDAGLAPLRIAVNVSAHQFSAGTVPEVVRAALEESGLAPQWLSVELTESVLMKEAGLAAHQIGQLRAMGIEVALDDFGTGYSSLAYLSRFALDKIKIDQSLVRHVTDDPKSAAIASATIALAHGLGLAVVAEGVETEEQLAFLRAAGCDQIQGYLYGRPVAPGRMAQLLAGGDLVA